MRCLPSGTVSFAAGETSKTITVNVAGDTIVEPDEGFTVTLSNPATGTTIGTATASGTIRPDDDADRDVGRDATWTRWPTSSSCATALATGRP